MNTYESSQKQLFSSQEAIYQKISNLENLQSLWNNVPKEHKDKIKDMTFTHDTVSFSVSPVGLVTLRIVDAQEPKMVKFGADNFPIQFNFWVQLVGVSDTDTRMKLTLKADIPLMVKPMIGNKLEKGIEQIADVMAQYINMNR